MKGADPATFKVLSATLARDGRHVFMLGKPLSADGASFEILSPSYARDGSTVFHIMETKLKPVAAADPASFTTLGDRFGRDAKQAFFGDKRLRLSKHGQLGQLTALGHVYAHDGAALFFGTKQVKLPANADVDWGRAGLKWLFEDGYDINLPPLIFFDGHEVWYRQGAMVENNGWAKIPDADFQTIEALDRSTISDGLHLRDAHRVWYRNGAVVEGADPALVSTFGSFTIRQENQLWVGARALEIAASDAAFVMTCGSGAPDYVYGDLLHLGDRVSICDAAKGVLEIARATPDARSTDAIASAALKPIFGRLFTILENFLPIINSPQDIARRLDPEEYQYRNDPAIAPVDPPPYELSVDGSGIVELRLACGTVLSQPASCWYRLGCHLWCHARGLAPELIPFTSAGTMLPDGMEMQHMLIRESRIAMWQFAAALYRAGAQTEARIIAHDLIHREMGRGWDRHREMIAEIANLPQALMDEFHYQPPKNGFDVSTNLAVARLIIAQGWLDAADFRDRLDVLSVIHGTMLATNQHTHFLTEIIPQVMARFDAEPLPAVQERMAVVLEAALIAGQVDLEVNQRFECESLLSIADFCIERGINTRLNHARRVEMLWGLDRVMKGDAAARDLVQRYGDDSFWPGVYAHRHAYRRTRLWLLAAQARIAWRPAGTATGIAQIHAARLDAMRAQLAALIAEYGPASADWDEVRDIKADLDRYGAAIDKG